MTEPRLHPADYVAGYLGKSTKWVYRHIDDLPHRRVGRSIRFTDDDIRQIVENAAANPAGEPTKTKKRTYPIA